MLVTCQNRVRGHLLPATVRGTAFWWGHRGLAWTGRLGLRFPCRSPAAPLWPGTGCWTDQGCWPQTHRCCSWCVCVASVLRGRQTHISQWLQGVVTHHSAHAGTHARTHTHTSSTLFTNTHKHPQTLHSGNLIITRALCSFRSPSAPTAVKLLLIIPCWFDEHTRQDMIAFSCPVIT